MQKGLIQNSLKSLDISMKAEIRSKTMLFCPTKKNLFQQKPLLNIDSFNDQIVKIFLNDTEIKGASISQKKNQIAIPLCEVVRNKDFFNFDIMFHFPLSIKIELNNGKIFESDSFAKTTWRRDKNIEFILTFEAFDFKEKK